MTNGVGTYSTTPASNTALFPEGMMPSALDDGMRQVEADIATWFQTSEWLDFADTPTYVSTTSFTVSGDQTAKYVQHRRIRCTDASTLCGTITSSSYSSPNTTVNVTLDSGSLSASLTAVALSSQMPTNVSSPSTIGRKGSTIASASTTDIGAATGDFVDISGTTAITALGTIAAGVMRTVRFTGALTLTHNATSLILPGAANITTANGDTAIFRSLGSGNWVCINYTKASGNYVTMRKGSDIASASTTDLSTATGDFIDVTGTTTITAFGTADAGIARTVRFTGALTLTHNATSLILPGSANITTADGDAAIFRSLGSGNWKCIAYTKADGTTLAGSGVTSVATSGLATGGTITSTGTITVTAATQSDQETATSTTTAVTPGRQHYHPGSAKAWARFNGAGTPAFSVSYNASSITDGGTGNWTVNWSITFSSSSHCAVSCANANGANQGASCVQGVSSTATTVNAIDAVSNAVYDGILNVIVFGDL